MTKESVRLALAVVLLIVGWLFSYQLARWGEPTSAWLWRDVLRVL